MEPLPSPSSQQCHWWKIAQNDLYHAGLVEFISHAILDKMGKESPLQQRAERENINSDLQFTPGPEIDLDIIKFVINNSSLR